MTSQFVDMTFFVPLIMFVTGPNFMSFYFIAGSGVMAAFIYKRLTRNPKILNTPA